MGEAHDCLEHYFHHQVLLFVVVASVEIKNLHLHLVVEEILIELVVVALDYYCLALIHLHKNTNNPTHKIVAVALPTTAPAAAALRSFF